jgi:hypothetical protein
MKSGILNTHEFETSINPFLQRGDFDGDGKVDFAAWVTKRDGWDLGLVFVHRVSGKVTIVGSGSPITGVGESDLTWADAWSVFEKGIVTTTRGAGPAPLLRGDAILLVNTEGAGGILWWTGKNYSWYTQGNEPPWRD